MKAKVEEVTGNQNLISALKVKAKVEASTQVEAKAEAIQEVTHILVVFVPEAVREVLLKKDTDILFLKYL